MTAIKNYIDRIEALEQEKRGLAEDIRGIYKEAKGNGLNPKTMRMVIQLRRLPGAERMALQEQIDRYMAELGG